MDRQEDFPDEKTQKPPENPALNNSQSSPNAGQRPGADAFQTENNPMLGATGKLLSLMGSQQPVKPQRTQPLSQRGPQIPHTPQESQAMPAGQPLRHFTLPQKTPFPAKTSLIGDHPSTVPLPPSQQELQPLQAPVHWPDEQFSPTNTRSRSLRLETLPPESVAKDGRKHWIARLQSRKWFHPLQAILLFAPITWTWLVIGLASLAYSTSLNNNPDLIQTPFLQMWAEGFPALKKSDFLLGIGHLPLIWDVGVTICLLVVLAFFTWVAQYPVKVEANDAQAKEKSTPEAINEAVVELRDILANLKTPVAAIESSVSKMANFESIAGQINSIFKDLSRAAPDIRKELRKLNDDQMDMMLDVRQSSTSMQDAAKAMREVAEPFRNEGIDKIVREAAERMEKLDILQHGISQQQISLYENQKKLQAGVVAQLDVLNQQMQILQQMRASQSQVDIAQIILALEQAGYSLQKEHALSIRLRKGWGWLKEKFSG